MKKRTYFARETVESAVGHEIIAGHPNVGFEYKGKRYRTVSTVFDRKGTRERFACCQEDQQ